MNSMRFKFPKNQYYVSLSVVFKKTVRGWEVVDSTK